jgi:hypothetical protein
LDQYFAVVFALAVAQYRSTSTEKQFYPDTDDLRYALILVNSPGANMEKLSNLDHGLKTKYFKPGAVKGVSRKI